MKIGYVYKLCCKDINIKEIYVGSTQAMRNRKSGHKRACNSESNKHHNYKVYQFIRDNGGWDLWNMVLIEKVEYSERCELLARERYYIETLGASLNCCMPVRTREERVRNNKKSQETYRDKNREKERDRHRAYRENNRDEIKERKKAYREKNREKEREYYQKNRERARLRYQRNKLLDFIYS